MMGLLSKLMGFADAKAIREALEGGAVVIDVRSPAEFAQGHFEGSRNIPVQDLQARWKELAKLDKTLILCCASGSRSASALNYLRQQGVENVLNAGPWTNVPC